MSTLFRDHWNAVLRWKLRPWRKVERLPGALALLVLLATPALSQSVASPANDNPPPAQAATADIPELSSQEEVQSFKVKVNLVELRVVVRDRNGNAIVNLKQEDFVLLDDKKPQTITKFSAERNLLPTEAAKNKPELPTGITDEVHSHLAESRRLAYLFDDFNATPNDLTRARKAAELSVDGLGPSDLLAIFTLSGQGNQDFTGDKEKLKAALRLLRPRPQGGPVTDCPPINYYIADQIISNGDGQAFQMVVQQIVACQFDGDTNPSKLPAQEAAAHSAIEREYRAGEAQAELALQTFNEVVRRVAVFQGQRTIVFMSPGFYSARQQAALNDSLARAIRLGVVVSTLDLRGVFAPSPTGTDISQKAWGSAVYGPQMLQYGVASDSANTDPLMQIANSTGGTFVHNNNDLSAGLAKLSAPPEFIYLLAFAPQNLANDGKFHALKVDLKQGSGLTVQTRTGYYAPKPEDSGDDAKREIAEAVFAHDEIHELPLRVQTQFFRSTDDAAHVSVLVHVDVRQMQFRKSDGRNLNELTVVAALFDRNANFVSAKSNTVRMHIKDQTLATKLGSGITVKSNFDVTPGSYLIRVVGRDQQGKMATQNEVVEIP
jgi:VWFA-related protein